MWSQEEHSRVEERDKQKKGDREIQEGPVWETENVKNLARMQAVVKNWWPILNSGIFAFSRKKKDAFKGAFKDICKRYIYSGTYKIYLGVYLVIFSYKVSPGEDTVAGSGHKQGQCWMVTEWSDESIKWKPKHLYVD